MGHCDLNKNLPEALLRWYAENARDLPWRHDREPYHVWLSEIMLQQTQVETVKPYYKRFLSELPTIGALACVDEEKLFKLWEGLGYYTRVRNLQKAAKIITRENSGVFPHEHEKILDLPGIGAYTAGAIASICFEAPTPAVDGNVLRVIARMTELEDDIASPAAKKKITAQLGSIYPPKQRGAFTQSLMELGATVCMPNGQAKCEKCPVRLFCKAFQNNTVTGFPVKKKKKERKAQDLTVFVLTCNQQIALCRREKKGLLAGMWEFPNLEGNRNEQQAIDLAASWGVDPVDILKTAQRVHRFTHVEWHMVCYHLSCGTKAERFHWVDRATLDDDYALASAFKICL